MPKRLLLCMLILFALAPRAGAQDGISKDLIAKYWPADDSQALDVAWCESRYDSNAENGQFLGVFQIGRRYHAERIRRLGYQPEDLRDAGKSAVIAYDIWKDSRSWSQWECRPGE